jgi:hypothetical protein
MNTCEHQNILNDGKLSHTDIRNVFNKTQGVSEVANIIIGATREII